MGTHTTSTAGTRSLTSRIEKLCREKGLKMTKQRRVIAHVLSESDDHPDAQALFRRASRVDPMRALRYE